MLRFMVPVNPTTFGAVIAPMLLQRLSRGGSGSGHWAAGWRGSNALKKRLLPCWDPAHAFSGTPAWTNFAGVGTEERD